MHVCICGNDNKNITLAKGDIQKMLWNSGEGQRQMLQRKKWKKIKMDKCYERGKAA